MFEQCVEKIKFSTNSKEHRKLTEVVIRIVRDVMPVNTVDQPGFLCNDNPRYVHKDYFNRITIPSMYENTREQISLKMKKEPH